MNLIRISDPNSSIPYPTRFISQIFSKYLQNSCSVFSTYKIVCHSYEGNKKIKYRYIFIQLVSHLEMGGQKEDRDPGWDTVVLPHREIRVTAPEHTEWEGSQYPCTIGRSGFEFFGFSISYN
jgi:hypothetical protein